MLFGIDLGGTKIEAVALDGDHPDQCIGRARKPTERHLGIGSILENTRSCLDDLCKSAGVSYPQSVGIGTPGTTDPSTGLLRGSNTTCLNDQPLQAFLSQTLEADVRLMNDANCFALAEARWGSAQGAGTVFAVILGTGVGGGVVVNGQILTGLHGIGGEWGHTPVPGFDAPCWCGRTGCLEAIACGPALAKFYKESGGGERPYSEIAVEESGRAQQTRDRLADAVAAGLGGAANLIDPDVIVLGGGVSQTPGLIPAVSSRLSQFCFAPEVRTRIVLPAYGDSAGVFGAAALFG